ncbi:hypothetical protein IO446_001894 [Campylobacter coli]|nr:hypothetical protein [Campylobacter coli]EGK8143720.1 hypothetical protein [Campylobacter coli]
MEDYSDEEIHIAQVKLNELYDRFTKEYGLINSRANETAFSNDSSYFLLCSLEKIDGEGKFVGKADIFSKRTIKAKKKVLKVDTPDEALILSIQDKAKVDLDYMQQLCKIDKEEIINSLEGVIFKVPDYENTNNWVTADEYLSGNVREKLKVAEQFNFTLQCAEVAISLFILDIGVYFFIKSIQSKNIFLLVIPIICFTENFGCYQAFVPVIIAILVEILILLNKNYNYSVKENIIFILKAFFVGVISLIGYFVIGKLVLHFFNLPPGTYLKDQILWLSEPIKNVILNILNYVKVIIEGNSTFYNHLYLIAIILTFITIIKNYKKVFCNLLSIILLLTPFIFSILIGNGLIVRMQLVLPIILAIIIIYNTNFKNNYFNYILYIIIFAFIFSQTKTTLNLFESDYARYTQDKTFADSIMEKISPLIDDENTTKIVFVGQRQQSGPSVHTTGETFGASFFFWDYLAPYGMSNRAIGFINTLGHHFQTITAEEFEMAKKVANEKNLASFPQNNSFCKYNNYIIIRLSN